MLPDLDTIALFVKVAELRSLTKASDASNIALAAASRRIALLEHHLKVSLLQRSSKGVELTPAGTKMLIHAKSLLMQVNQMQADMADYSTGRKGVLRVLANTSAITQFLPADLQRYTRDNPEVSLVVEERWSAEIVRRVLAGDADVGIIMDGVSAIGLDTTPYRSDQLAVILPQGHPIATAHPFGFDDVLDYDLIGLEGDSAMMRLLTQMAVSCRKVLRLRIQVRSFEAVCGMVQAGLGIGLLPQQAANAFEMKLGLIVRPLSEGWATRQMLTCFRRDNPKKSLVAGFVETLCS